MSEIRQSLRKFGKKIKLQKDKMLLPILAGLTFLRISPLFLSLAALIAGILAAIFFDRSKDLFLILVIINFFLDLLDGALARYQGKNSGQGWWFDYILDRIVVIFVMGAVIFSVGFEFVYAAVPLTYLLVHLIYMFFRKKLVVLYVHPIYFLMLYFNVYAASIFSVAVDAINLILFVILFIIGAKRKGHLSQ